MNIFTYADTARPARQIDGMEGETYTVLAVATRASIFPNCQRHDITIGRGTYSKALVVHAQGIAPVVGAEVRRKRRGGNGVALIWANAAGKVTGGGFTTACVPADWRVPAKAVSTVSVGDLDVKVEVEVEPAKGFKDRINAYTCETCDHVTVTVDLDTGVTPFMIGCTYPGCGGTAKSSMYHVRPGLVPTNEWFKPTDLPNTRR